MAWHAIAGLWLGLSTSPEVSNYLAISHWRSHVNPAETNATLVAVGATSVALLQ
jgi:hypothetical protein